MATQPPKSDLAPLLAALLSLLNSPAGRALLHELIVVATSLLAQPPAADQPSYPPTQNGEQDYAR